MDVISAAVIMKYSLPASWDQSLRDSGEAFKLGPAQISIPLTGPGMASWPLRWLGRLATFPISRSSGFLQLSVDTFTNTRRRLFH